MPYLKRINLVSTLTFFLFVYTLLTSQAQAATYNSATGELFLPSLVVDNTTLTDVTIKLKPDGSFSIQNSSTSALPFRCTKAFTESTLDEIKNADSVEEVNNLLGCRVYIATRTEIEVNDTVPASSGDGGIWSDINCSQVTVGFIELLDAPTSSVVLNKSGCLSSISSPGLYHLYSNLFLIQFVVIDNKTLATEVVLKFHRDNRYELINATLVPLAAPSHICRTVTEAGFRVIPLDATADTVNDILGCQFQQTTVTTNTETETQAWVDHQCSQLSISRDSNTGYKVNSLISYHAGCGSFEGN